MDIGPYYNLARVRLIFIHKDNIFVRLYIEARLTRPL